MSKSSLHDRAAERRRFLAGLAALPLMGSGIAAASRFDGIIERSDGTPFLSRQRPAPPPHAALAPRTVAEPLAAPAQPLRARAAGPRLAIVIDDIGNRLEAGRQTVNLPGQVTCSFLPHTAHAEELAREAHRLGREIILHVPMESVHHKPLGPGGLTRDMGRAELRAAMRDNLLAVPNATGVSNHMGSLLTGDRQHMAWLMEVLAADQDRPYFLDSLTTAGSVAYRSAREYGLPSLKRNIFLDHHQGYEEVTRQFEKVVERALRKGEAIGIGHPYPATLAVLEEQLPRLARRGIELVPASRLL